LVVRGRSPRIKFQMRRVECRMGKSRVGPAWHRGKINPLCLVAMKAADVWVTV